MNRPHSGFALARALGPDEALRADIVESMLPQLLVALVKRAGNTLTIPVSEIDDTGGNLLSMSYDEVARTFTFIVTQKQ